MSKYGLRPGSYGERLVEAYVPEWPDRVLPRVDCPACGRSIAARKDGTPRDHDEFPGRSPRGPVCPGAYR